MKLLYAIVLLGVFSMNTWGHGGTDPLLELQKNAQLLAEDQALFAELGNRQDQLNNLNSQLRHLGNNVMILQDMMAKEYPHVREKMSRYKLDYVDKLKDSLKGLRQTLKHASQISQE